MNAQEREQLNQFLQQLVNIKLAEKDNEAADLINASIAQQPDAAYLLTQRCLLQDQALQVAQAQIADLQRQLQQKNTSASNNSFLNDNPWAPASSNTNSVPGASNYQIPSTPPAQDNAAYARPTPQNAGFGSSFLGNVATTAAGVVAGSFLFQGIGNLLGQHTTHSAWGQQPNNAEHFADQTIINNYYADSDQLASSEANDIHLASYDDDNFVDDSDLDSDWI